MVYQVSGYEMQCMYFCCSKMFMVCEVGVYHMLSRWLRYAKYAIMVYEVGVYGVSSRCFKYVFMECLCIGNMCLWYAT